MNTHAKRILEIVAETSGFPVEEITGKRRTAALVKARHQAMRQIRAETNLSTSEIGRLFNRDHSTVIYACNHKAQTNELN